MIDEMVYIQIDRQVDGYTERKVNIRGDPYH